MSETIIFDPNLPFKKDLWVSTYKSVINGLFKNDMSVGTENHEAKKIANRAIKDYEEQFEKD